MNWFQVFVKTALPAIVSFFQKGNKAPQPADQQSAEPPKPVVIANPYDNGDNVISFEEFVTASGKYPDRLKSPELTDEVKKNIEAFLPTLNAYLAEIGAKSVEVSSGFRPSGVNSTTKGAAKKSNHLMGNAVDLKDKDGALRKLILANLPAAKKHGVYFEDFRWTDGWAHIQPLPPGSKKRIYVPSTSPMTNPKAWDGSYPSEFDK